jgi:hypothetical protein
VAVSSIQAFVDTIAAKAGVEPAAAETVVGTILSVIEQEGDGTKVANLFNQIPGAADLARQHVVTAGGGGGILGALSGVADKYVGGGTGILMAGFAQIEATNLTLAQIKTIGTALVAHLEEVNPTIAKAVFDAVPGLKARLGA